jgi:hypothetical protein
MWKKAVKSVAVTSKTGGPRSRARFASAALAMSLLAGCASARAPSPADALPGANTLSGWTPLGPTQTYNRKTLFQYIDGSAEYFFTYGFEELAVQEYGNTGGTELTVEIWRSSTSSDAYGLFSSHLHESMAILKPAAGAALETGSRLYFWQDRFYVLVNASTEASDGDLNLFASFISDVLPSGGEIPALVNRLPAEEMEPGSAQFFHEELAIQSRVFLGGENLLGLSHDTDGVLASYNLDGSQAYLLLVEYPDAGAAGSGLAALQSGRIKKVAASDVQGKYLGAVFGKVDENRGKSLLAEALGG